jgi:hypothetical protein
MLANSMQKPFSGNKIGNLTFWTALVCAKCFKLCVCFSALNSYVCPLWPTL